VTDIPCQMLLFAVSPNGKSLIWMLDPDPDLSKNHPA